LLVFCAAVVHLDGFELQTFGVRIDGVHDAATAWNQRTYIEMVRRGHRKPD